MRRPVLTVGLAGIVAALAVTPALAAQTNTYGVQAKVTPTVKRATAKPTPVKVNFAYTVGEQTGLQPAAVKSYKIAFAGLRDNMAKYKPGTLIGKGKVNSFVYLTADPSGARGFPCAKDLRVYAAGKHKASLVIDGPGSACGGVGALPPIAAKFVPAAGHGTALQFELPPTILHPISGLTVAVRSVSSTLKLGALSSAGFKGTKRPVVVTFVTEAGQTATAKTTA
jgi:hypothetical protein